MGMITIKIQSAASVPLPAVDQLRVFVDSSDSILKTKDSFGVVRPSGVGTADELATTGAPVDVSASSPPTVGQVLTATTPTSAVWSNPSGAALAQTAVQVGGVSPAYSSAVGELIRCDISGGDQTVNLPGSHSAGDQIGIKVVSIASGNEASVLPNGGDLIDGAGSLSMNTDYEWAILQSDGTDWMQIG